MAPATRYTRTMMSLFDLSVLFTPDIIMKSPILSIIIFLMLSFILFPITRPSILPAKIAMKSVIIPIFFLSDIIFRNDYIIKKHKIIGKYMSFLKHNMIKY